MMRILITVTAVFFIIACSSPTEKENNAPDDHTVSQDGVMHKSGLNDPQNNCTGCHGTDLRGSDKAPSCYSCHGKEW